MTWERGHKGPLPLPIHRTWTNECTILPLRDTYSNIYDSVSHLKNPIGVEIISAVNLQAGAAGLVPHARQTDPGPPPRAPAPCSTSAQCLGSWHTDLGTRETLFSRPPPRTRFKT